MRKYICVPVCGRVCQHQTGLDLRWHCKASPHSITDLRFVQTCKDRTHMRFPNQEGGVNEGWWGGRGGGGGGGEEGARGTRRVESQSDNYFTFTFTYPIAWLTVGAPLEILQPAFSSLQGFSAFHSIIFHSRPVHSSDVVFPSFPLSASSSPPSLYCSQ